MPSPRIVKAGPKMMAYGEKVNVPRAAIVGQRRAREFMSEVQADLHTCRMCTFFDPGSRFECRKPLTARILNKGGRNSCELFAARTVVERETSSGKPTDARQAFANLFKK
jgi:hypothetical protein